MNGEAMTQRLRAYQLRYFGCVGRRRYGILVRSRRDMVAMPDTGARFNEQLPIGEQPLQRPGVIALSPSGRKVSWQDCSGKVFLEIFLIEMLHLL